jgi:hypothetical protein
MRLLRMPVSFLPTPSSRKGAHGSKSVVVHFQGTSSLFYMCIVPPDYNNVHTVLFQVPGNSGRAGTPVILIPFPLSFIYLRYVNHGPATNWILK